MSPGFLKAAAAGETGIRRWFLIAAVIVAFWFTVATATAALVLYSRHNPVDFLSYWAAGKLAFAGHAASAYDIHLHKAVEQTVAPITGLLPFP